MNASSVVQKVWNYCHTLRDDGVGYGDYLEQLTYLLFLKMAHEYTPPNNGHSYIGFLVYTLQTDRDKNYHPWIELLVGG